MCGRARLSADVGEIKLVFGVPPERPAPNFAPSWNVAPTDPLPVVRYDAKDKQRSLDIMRWGRGDGLPLARTAGVESPDDQPGAHFLEGTSTGDRDTLKRGVNVPGGDRLGATERRRDKVGSAGSLFLIRKDNTRDNDDSR
jgi:hypothetical protein